MFTGLIEAVGRVEQFAARDLDAGGQLRVATDLGAALAAGESVAVNGVCLTVTACDAGGFDAAVSPQTLRVTALAGLTPARAVNLERAVRADARFGGHFVLGHVDGIGRVTSRREDGDSRWLEIGLPAELMPGVVDKGSIAIDGVSLTVAAVTPRGIGLQVVPFTLEHTSLGAVEPGDSVNIETDVLGKYVARLLQASRLAAASEGR